MSKCIRLWSIVLVALLGAGVAQAAITTDITGLKSTSHSSQSSTLSVIAMSWTAPVSNSTNGLAGYSHTFDRYSSATVFSVPSQTLSASLTTVSSNALADGTWYFHIRAIDSDGSSGAVLTSGPFIINNTPVVSSVSPTSGGNDASRTITISGSNFASGASVKMGSTTLTSSVTDTKTITATVPKASTAGTYDITVTNSNQKSGTKAGAYQVTSANVAPTAVAAATPSPATLSGASITLTLDASQSTDSDGSVDIYSWSIDSYAGANKPTLSSSSAQKPTVTVDAYGNYTFGLIVKDNQGQTSAKTTVTVAVNTPSNAAPTAKVTALSSVVVKDAVSLSSSGSTDPEGKSLTFAWSLSGKPTGSSAVVTSSTKATASFTPDVAGNFTVQLTVTDNGGLTDTKTQNVTAAFGVVDAAKTTVMAAVSDIYADGVATTTIIVTPKDKNGNTIGAGQSVTATTISGSLAVFADNGDGTYSATLTSAASTGSATITVTVGSTAITSTAAVNFIAAKVDAAASTIAAQATTLKISTDTYVTVTPKDKYGNLVGTGAIVIVTDNYGTFANNGRATSNGDGSYTVKLTAPANIYSDIISATVDGTSLTSTASISYVNTSVTDAATSTVVSSVTNGVAGVDSYIITVTLKDSAAAVITTAPTVSIAVTGSNNVYTQATAANGSGVVVFTISSTKAENKTVTITDTTSGVVLTLKPVITFVAGSVDAATSSVVATTTSSIFADGAASGVMTITLKDSYSNLVVGSVPQVSVTGTANSYTQPAATDSTGVTTLQVASTYAQTKTVTVTGVTQTASLTFVAGAADAGNTLFILTPASLPADGASTATISVTVKDKYGNLVDGLTNVSVTSSKGTLSKVSALGGGRYQATLTAPTVAASASVNILVGGNVVSTGAKTVTFTVGAVSAGNTAVSLSPGTILINTYTTVTVTPFDAFANPLAAGQTVSVDLYSVSAGLLDVYSSTLMVDNGDGTYGGLLTASSPYADAVVRATVNGVVATLQPALGISAASLDVDGNGVANASDGVLILRALNGAGTITTGVSIPNAVSGVGNGRARTNNEIKKIITDAAIAFDVDGGGTVNASDGVLMLRALNGAGTITTGVSLPAGVGGAGANGARSNAEIKNVITKLKP